MNPVESGNNNVVLNNVLWKSTNTMLRTPQEEDQRFHLVTKLRDARGLTQRPERCSTAGVFDEMARATRSSTVTRRKLGRLMVDSEVTGDYLRELWQKQNGRCFYSNIPMVDLPYSEWQVSVERLDPDLGYERENVVLIVWELNCAHRQWTPDKIKTIVSVRNRIFDILTLRAVIQHARRAGVFAESKEEYRDRFAAGLRAYGRTSLTVPFRFKRRQHTTPKLNWFYQTCERCKLQLSTNCTCVSGRQLRKWFQALVASSKTTSKLREGARSEFNLSTDFLLDLLESQQGRCHYSNIPMTFKHGEDWSASIERMDTAKGYTQDNVCLICVEFNTMAQWSQAKFGYFLKHINDVPLA